MKNLSQNIKFIEYCSFAGKEGNKYDNDKKLLKIVLIYLLVAIV